MSIENSSITKLTLPDEPKVQERLNGFYNDIGWNIHTAKDSLNQETLTFVSPNVSDRSPTVAYLTEMGGRALAFTYSTSEHPSHYASGTRLAPYVMKLVQVSMFVQNDRELANIVECGGALLDAHRVDTRDDSNSSIQIVDPFGYHIGVSTNPEWVRTLREQETKDRLRIGLKDLQDFEQANRGKISTSTRAWRGLISAGRLTKALDFSSDSSNNPKVAYLSYYDTVDGLSLESAKQLLDSIDTTSTRRFNEDIARKFGRNVGPKIIEFLQEFMKTYEPTKLKDQTD